MFDIGFSELLVIGVVALVVLGPERLPKVARTAGHLFGRLQRYVATVKADLNREMDMSELSKVRQEVQEAARAFEQSTKEQTSAFESEARALSEAMQKTAAEVAPAGAAASQTALLQAQEQGMTAPVPEAAPLPPASAAVTASASPAAVPAASRPASWAPPPAAPGAAQGTLDLGIEPARVARS
jgi:sec-independent protein translocase protein TatB